MSKRCKFRETDLKDTNKGTFSCNSVTIEGLSYGEKDEAQKCDEHLRKETYIPSTLLCGNPYDDGNTECCTKSDTQQQPVEEAA